MSDDVQTTEAPSADASATPRASLLRRRPSKLQVASVVLVTLLAFGPLVALVVAIRADDGPIDALVVGPPAPEGGARLAVTVIGVSPSTGELRARLNVVPRDELLDGSGRPAEDLVLQVNDLRGMTTYELPAGDPLRPVEVTVALTDGSITRYPFDTYRSRIAAAVTHGGGDEGPEALPLATDVSSNVTDLNVSVAAGTETETETEALSVVDLEVDRQTSTTAYAVWTMVLMWGLAVAGVMIVWAVTIWGAEPPLWSYAYLVGVLFALPQLRDQLPGRPPPGTLIDFVAFYWSIAIVGISLIIALGIWIRANRPTPDTEDPAA